MRSIQLASEEGPRAKLCITCWEFVTTDLMQLKLAARAEVDEESPEQKAAIPALA